MDDTLYALEIRTEVPEVVVFPLALKDSMKDGSIAFTLEGSQELIAAYYRNIAVYVEECDFETFLRKFGPDGRID